MYRNSMLRTTAYRSGCRAIRSIGQHHADSLFIAGIMLTLRNASVPILPFCNRDVNIDTAVILINGQIF